MSRYEFSCPLFVTKDTSDGEMYVTGIASDTIEDNDTERMSTQALEDMKSAVTTKTSDGNSLDLLPGHLGVFRLGKIVSSDVLFEERVIEEKDLKVHRNVYEFYIRAWLRKDHPDAHELFNNIENYQMSIGGIIDFTKSDAVFYEKTKDGRTRRVINRISLDHIAITRKGWASVGRTRFDSAFIKGGQVGNCSVAAQIWKSVEQKEISDKRSNFGVKEYGMDGDQTVSDETKNVAVLSKEDLAAKNFAHRFKNTLALTEGINMSAIAEGVVALRVVKSDVLRLAGDLEKAGGKFEEEELKDLYATWVALGAVLKEHIEEKQPEVVADEATGDNAQAVTTVSTEEASTLDSDNDDDKDEGKAAAEGTAETPATQTQEGDAGSATPDVGDNTDKDMLAAIQGLLNKSASDLEASFDKKLEAFKSQIQSEQAARSSVSTQPISRQGASVAVRTKDVLDANDDDDDPDIFNGVINKTVMQSVGMIG